MLEAILFAALVASPTPLVQEATPTGRGWTIQCAVVARYVREDAVDGLGQARINENQVAMIARQNEINRLDAIYQAANAAPSDIADNAERYALARRFRDEAYGMENSAREDVLTTCELVLGLPMPA